MFISFLITKKHSPYKNAVLKVKTDLAVEVLFPLKSVL